MPNHCVNFLTLTGIYEDVEALLKHVQSSERKFCFSTIVPYPEKFQKLDDASEKWEKENPGKWHGRPVDGFNSGGIEWCYKNWGTKWNAYATAGPAFEGGEQKPGEHCTVHLIFETAWSPPIPVMKAMAKTFPKVGVTLSYFESGMGICGEWSSDEDVEDWKQNYQGSRGG